MIFAIDADGAIVENAFPKIGKEIPGAIQTMSDLQEGGHKIILWTVREDPELAEFLGFLATRGFSPDAVNKNIQKFSSSPKVYADIYIDDHSFPRAPTMETLWETIRIVFLPRA